MAKVITQETFNEVVKENVEEFDMTEEEAIADAVNQFQAQGVILSNIIKDPSKAEAILASVLNLAKLMKEEESPSHEITKVLQQLGENTKGEISTKLLAAEKGAYPLLIQCLKKSTGSLTERSMEALIILMDGYPDLMDAEGTTLLLGLLEESTPVGVVLLALRWLLVAVTKHERTRAALIRGQVAHKLRALSEQHGAREDVVAAVCAATQVLILDDDVRVVHGDAHEHARALATELLPLLTLTLSKHVADVSTTAQLLSALGSMLVRNEFCITFHEHQGLRYVMDAMVEHPNDEKVARECLLLLKGLAGSDEVKEPIIAAGAAPLLVASLEKHYKNSNVAVAACMCLAALSLRSPINSRELALAGAPETLVRCMTHWKQNQSIMKQGCAAIRNQVSRCPDLRSEYASLQVEELLRDAKELHGDLAFEAKSVLLDLGCDVKLKEEWRGTGVQLTQ